MGRIRTIKPEFHAHEELSALPAETHLLAAALVNYADDYGYFNANPLLVKAGTNPLRKDRTPMEEQLKQLQQIGYIEIRRQGLKCYGVICNFEAHQRVSHPTDSKIKPKFYNLPKVSCDPPDDSRTTPELFAPEQGREQGRELNGTSLVDDEPADDYPALRVYKSYPHKVGKAAALKAIEKALALLLKRKEPAPEKFLIERIGFWLKKRDRDRDAKIFVPDYPHPATWFNEGRYDDESNLPAPKREVHVMTQREVDEDNYRHLGTPPPEEWAPEGVPQGWVPCRN